MFKSNLQELCQKRSWSLPKYSITKQGLDHNPSFSATVLVNHLSFHTLTHFKSSKEAQNDAARVAFEHFSISTPTPTPTPTPTSSIPCSSSFPQPSLPLSSESAGETFPHTVHVEQHQIAPANYCTSRVNLQVDEITPVSQENNNKFRDVQHLYKNELQTYAQKRNLVFPVYSCEREGPPHASRFKCKVTIDGKTYESAEFFSILKEAENAAAKVALTSLSPEGVENDDSAFYKNLLQQLIQKVGFHLPTYNTNRFGEAHSPVFVSTVEIEGEHFLGEKAKTKKQAEISAAKVAYNTLRECKSKLSQTGHVSPPPLEGQEAAELLLSSLQSSIPTKVHKNVRPNVPAFPSPSETHTQSAENIMGADLPSANISNGSAEKKSPSAANYECSTESNSSSTSNCFNNSALDSSSLKPLPNKINLSYKKITVYPAASKQIPNGTTLLPIRDNNWVAFCFP